VEFLTTIVVLLPILLSIVLASIFFSRLVSNSDPKPRRRLFKVSVEEVLDDGNILVSDTKIFSDGVVVSNTKGLNVGQEVFIKKTRKEWNLV